MDDNALATVIWIVMLVVFGLPLAASLIIGVIFSIFKNMTDVVGDTGKALALPAIFGLIYKYLNDRKKDEEK